MLQLPIRKDRRPFTRCTQKPQVTEPPQPKDPCNPDLCGSNAKCSVQSGKTICSCIQNYQGDPLIGCKPECLLNQDCPSDKTCINSKCLNPVQEHVESILNIKCPTIITYTLFMRATPVTPFAVFSHAWFYHTPRTIRPTPAFTLWTQ